MHRLISIRRLITIKIQPEIGQIGANLELNTYHRFPNEFVRKGEILFSFYVDRVPLDVCSPINGVIVQHLVPISTAISTGTSIMTIRPTSLSSLN